MEEPETTETVVIFNGNLRGHIQEIRIRKKTGTRFLCIQEWREPKEMKQKRETAGNRIDRNGLEQLQFLWFLLVSTYPKLYKNMWRWPTVAGQKEASAKAKSKIYTIHAKLISLAAEKGADPSINGALGDAITSAKRAGVTADVIDRAVRRGAGLDKESAKVEEIFYEGYATGWVAIIVRALTDNRNRTAPSMRHIFSAFGGNMWETGSVSNFAFEYRGRIVVEEPSSREELEMAIMETPAEDYTFGDEIEIITEREHLQSIKTTLIENWYTLRECSLGYRAKNYTPVTDFDTALKLYSMLREFDDDEDVETVWNTADISETLWKEVESYVEARRFRT